MSKLDYTSLLRRFLPPDAWESLRTLAARRRLPLFEYDAVNARVEPALDDLDPEGMAEDSVDVVFTACDVLNRHIAQLDITSLQTAHRPVRETAEHIFDFAAEDDEYTVFVQLLRPLVENAAIRMDIIKQPGHIRLIIELSYYGEHDYQQKKDQLYFFRDLARRKAMNAPYSGNRC